MFEGFSKPSEYSKSIFFPCLLLRKYLLTRTGKLPECNRVIAVFFSRGGLYIRIQVVDRLARLAPNQAARRDV